MGNMREGGKRDNHPLEPMDEREKGMAGGFIEGLQKKDRRTGRTVRRGDLSAGGKVLRKN